MKEDEIKNKSNDEYGLKTPPPREYTTARGRLFEFGKPALRHRKIITKVLKLMSKPTADYDAIVKCAKNRKMSVEEFIKLDENQLTPDEMRLILKDSSPEKNAEYADMMNEILSECLFATIKKAPFQFSTIDELEDKMDNYGEAVELFPIAVKWVAMAASELGRMNRKN